MPAAKARSGGSSRAAWPPGAPPPGCPALRAEGRRFEVRIDHAPRAAAADRPLELDVAAALRQLIADGLDGDVLTFLPGAAEIRRAQGACAELAERAGIDVVMLHG